MNRPQTALVLGGTNAHIPLLQRLKARGFKTLLLDYHANPVARPFADRHLQISALDHKQVSQLAREQEAAMVISTCSDQLNLVACTVAAELGLSAPYSPQTALEVTHKRHMKAKMQAHGIPTAPYHCVRSWSEWTEWYEQAPSDFVFPLLVKPVDSCGSKGVRKAHNAWELQQYLETALNLSRRGQALIEPFLTGREICADYFVQNGVPHLLSSYEKYNLFSPQTVIQCFRSLRPAPLSAAVQRHLAQLAQQLTTAFELHNTALFVQTLLPTEPTGQQDRERLFVIEFAARVPGGLAYRASELASGFDAIDASIDTFLGRPVQIRLQPCQHYITTNSIYGRSGNLGWVSGHTELLAAGVIDEFSFYKTSGMSLSGELASRDRVAGFIVQDPDRERLFQRTDTALQNLEIFNPAGQPIMLRAPFWALATPIFNWSNCFNVHVPPVLKYNQHNQCRNLPPPGAPPFPDGSLALCAQP